MIKEIAHFLRNAPAIGRLQRQLPRAREATCSSGLTDCPSPDFRFPNVRMVGAVGGRPGSTEQ